MTKRAIALVGTALALGVSGPALAQSASGGMDPATMTCSDLSAMEQDRQEGAIYFVAGYQSGGMAGGITGATGTSASGSAAGATTESGGTAATGTTAGTDTTAGATGTTTGSSGDAGSAGSTDTSGAAGSTMMASVDFDRISADQIMSACAESPDRMVSDILHEQSGSASQ